jgi:predicted RNA binding protein YcfA (HicA-like mRNA interferase family)
MPKLCPLKPREIEKIICKHGFVLNHTKGSHKQFFNFQKHLHTTIPYHSGTVDIGTLRSIIRQTQIDVSEFRK